MLFLGGFPLLWLGRGSTWCPSGVTVLLGWVQKRFLLLPMGLFPVWRESLFFPGIHCALRGVRRRPPCCLPSPPHSLNTLSLREGSLLPPWERCPFEFGIHGRHRVPQELLYF